MRLSAACLLVLVVAAGCGRPDHSEPSRRIDPDADDQIGGVGTESGDIRAMSDQFVRSMLAVPEIAEAEEPPRVALVRVQNRVDDVSLRFDSEILPLRMRAELNRSARGEIRFLARSAEVEAAVQQERGAKEAGLVSGDNEQAISGADYFMTGEIRSLTKNSSRGKSAYIIYAFQLVDAETSEIVWEDFYEQKREALRGAAHR